MVRSYEYIDFDLVKSPFKEAKPLEYSGITVNNIWYEPPIASQIHLLHLIHINLNLISVLNVFYLPFVSRLQIGGQNM